MPIYLNKTHAGIGRTCKVHTKGPQPDNAFERGIFKPLFSGFTEFV